jgi:hypothetical protein
LIEHAAGYHRAVPRFWRLFLVLAAVLLLWAGFAYNVTRPPDDRAYRRTVVQVAESVHDGVGTAWLVGREKLAGRVFETFATAGFDDALKAVGGAADQFAENEPPDGPSARLRDELAPLVASAVRWLGDAAHAADDKALRVAADALGPLADRLAAFVAANQ